MANYQNIVPLQIAQAAVTGTAVKIYTVPSTSANSATGTGSIVTSTTRTYLKDINICNTTAGAVTISIFLVPSGGTAGTSNALYYATSVAANSVLRWTGAQILMTSSTIWVQGSTTGLTVTISGGEAQ